MKIISGGQTGVDRAALDVALDADIPHGGWCPKGRRAEDGPIPSQYCLQETDSADYAFRTEQNVLASDATLILCRGPLSGGTLLTLELVEKIKKPYRIVDLNEPASPEDTAAWIQRSGISLLNVAGPRESQNKGIYQQAFNYLVQVFALQK